MTTSDNTTQRRHRPLLLTDVAKHCDAFSSGRAEVLAMKLSLMPWPSYHGNGQAVGPSGAFACKRDGRTGWRRETWLNVCVCLFAFAQSNETHRNTVALRHDYHE